jgi:hypothetical protein
MHEQLIASQTNKTSEQSTIVVNNRVNEIVKEMLQKHVGGKEFFENLDLSVRNYDVVQSLYDLIEKVNGTNLVYFIVTGRFGIFFSNWIRYYGTESDILYIVNGGLREGEEIISLELFKNDLNRQGFIIIDDSYYSGKTNNIIKQHVESLGGRYEGTFVVYDGSPEKSENVHSLYRYYESK